MEIMGNNNACKCVNGKYWEIMGNTDGKYWEILGNTGKYWEILGNTGNHQIYIFITSKSKHLQCGRLLYTHTIFGFFPP
jgi:hypothetical protein